MEKDKSRKRTVRIAEKQKQQDGERRSVMEEKVTEKNQKIKIKTKNRSESESSDGEIVQAVAWREELGG